MAKIRCRSNHLLPWDFQNCNLLSQQKSFVRRSHDLVLSMVSLRSSQMIIGRAHLAPKMDVMTTCPQNQTLHHGPRLQSFTKGPYHDHKYPSLNHRDHRKDVAGEYSMGSYVVNRFTGVSHCTRGKEDKMRLIWACYHQSEMQVQITRVATIQSN